MKPAHFALLISFLVSSAAYGQPVSCLGREGSHAALVDFQPFHDEMTGMVYFTTPNEPEIATLVLRHNHEKWLLRQIKYGGSNTGEAEGYFVVATGPETFASDEELFIRITLPGRDNPDAEPKIEIAPKLTDLYFEATENYLFEPVECGESPQVARVEELD